MDAMSLEQDTDGLTILSRSTAAEQQLDRTSASAFTFTGSQLPYKLSAYEKVEIKDARTKASHYSQFLQFMGVHELFLPSLYRAVLIELCASAVFVYFHIAIVISAANNGSAYPPEAIALLHALLLPVLILSFGRSSGAHLNSLVSMSAVATRHMPVIRGLLYIIVQILGSFFGALAMTASVPESLAESVGLGGCNPGSLSSGQVLCIEFFACLIMLIPTYGTAFNEKQRAVYGSVLPPFFIGMALFVMLYSIAGLGSPPFTPGGFPNMCLGISMAYNTIVPYEDAFMKPWVYWVGPVIAVTVNAVLYGIAPPAHDEDDDEEVKKTV